MAPGIRGGVRLVHTSAGVCGLLRPLPSGVSGPGTAPAPSAVPAARSCEPGLRLLCGVLTGDHEAVLGVKGADVHRASRSVGCTSAQQTRSVLHPCETSVTAVPGSAVQDRWSPQRRGTPGAGALTQKQAEFRLRACTGVRVWSASRLTGFSPAGRAAGHLRQGILGTSATTKRLRLNTSATSTPATPSSSA